MKPATFLFLLVADHLAAQGWGGLPFLPDNLPIPNPSGFASTVSTTGRIELDSPFFQDMGSNGRRCVTCHVPTAGWTITPSQVQAIFESTRGGEIHDQLGLSAIFRPNDGAVSPTADVSTLAARRQAYAMLLSKGLIRVGLPIPANAEFELAAVDDPYGYASAAELSLFRRPLPTTNLKFMSGVLWDGRETFANESIAFGLLHQSNAATVGHAQATAALTAAQRQAIVDFEMTLHTAQMFDWRAGLLYSGGARGGPAAVVAQPFYLGMNDLFGDAVTLAPFDPTVFDIYDAWTGANPRGRAAVARGQELFDHKPIAITGVAGINDDPAFGEAAVVQGSCTTCHDAPNAGGHSVEMMLDIGIGSAAHRTADLPLYTLRNLGSHATVQSSDPGRALVTGRWRDIGKLKPPVLRGLAARAPYFHNGSAATLADVVDFYDQRFGIGFTAGEKSDLVAFLQAL